MRQIPGHWTIIIKYPSLKISTSDLNLRITIHMNFRLKLAVKDLGNKCIAVDQSQHI